MIDFGIDWMEEADREARLDNETNHFKKRKINGYFGNKSDAALDEAAIADDRYRRFEKGM